MVLRTTCRAQQETQTSGKIQDPAKLPTEPQLVTATIQSSSDGKFFSTWVTSLPTYIPGSLPPEQQSPGLAKDCTPPSTPPTTPPHSECICCKSVVCVYMRGGPRGSLNSVIMNSTYETACMCNECGNITTQNYSYCSLWVKPAHTILYTYHMHCFTHCTYYCVSCTWTIYAGGTAHEPTARRSKKKGMTLQSFGQKNVPCSAHRNLEKAVCWIYGYAVVCILCLGCTLTE